jgi:hypothetical protein
MGGGLMQLVAYGAQDVYLTGNPQITYFKVVYRRHTNFSMETIEHTLSGNPDFGRKSNVTVLRNGDLATKTCLKIKINAVSLSNAADKPDQFVAWVRRLGHCLVKSCEVEIGGSRIDKQYGTWLDIWYELTHTSEQERGYKCMIGDVDELTKLIKVPVTEGEVLPEYTLYIPMQFWFNRNTGLALPLIALQYHEVRLYFEFEDVSKLIIWSGSSAPDSKAFSMKDASILVDYIYLDSEERRRFAQVGHEYLIEQLQFTGDETISDSGNGTRINGKFKLGFNHPCKEIIWALKAGAYNGESTKNLSGNKGRFLTYTHRDEKWESDALDYAAENLARGMVTDVAGNLSSDADAVVVNLIPAKNVVTVVINGVTTVNVKYTGTDLSGSTSQNIRIVKNPLVNGGNYNLATQLGEFDVNVVIDSSHVISSWTVIVVSHSMSLTDVSVPIEDYVDCRTTTASNGLNIYDVTVVQCCNYGVRLDGKGNAVQEANLQLNGHDRFDMMEGGYFNYYQPHNHHTRTPADGINVYSFGLHPEQHQPNGTANLSRIDNTLLVVRFSDPLRANKNIPKLSLSRDSKFLVFAFSYNVLRIMSGMGGLAYSN